MGPDLMLREATRVPRRKLRREERLVSRFLRRMRCSYLGFGDTVGVVGADSNKEVSAREGD